MNDRGKLTGRETRCQRRQPSRSISPGDVYRIGCNLSAANTDKTVGRPYFRLHFRAAGQLYPVRVRPLIPVESHLQSATVGLGGGKKALTDRPTERRRIHS